MKKYYVLIALVLKCPDRHVAWHTKLLKINHQQLS